MTLGLGLGGGGAEQLQWGGEGGGGAPLRLGGGTRRPLPCGVKHLFSHKIITKTSLEFRNINGVIP